MVKFVLKSGKEIELTLDEFQELKGIIGPTTIVNNPPQSPWGGWPIGPEPPYKVGDFPPFDGGWRCTCGTRTTDPYPAQTH